MKIAVPTKEGNRIDDHFGHCEFYTIYTISDDDKKVVDKQKLESPQGCGCKTDIAYDLEKMDVRVMLAGGIGQGAINKLAAQNIKVIRNCRGDVDVLINEYLAGNIVDGGQSCAAHANHEAEGHVCNH
ncbi:MAG: NifB/NifX family molybdenum-iron cluster-binding protein [Paludibacter sp.]|nr:NifB/NifX family molybdenum-iron cluster-binding protein [Paludibacter sp.]